MSHADLAGQQLAEEQLLKKVLGPRAEHLAGEKLRILDAL